MSNFVQISTTTSDRAQAERIATALVDGRLAACVQIVGPVRSIYRWQDKVEQADEWFCIAKTRQSLFTHVDAKIHELHSYECPEIVATALIEISPEYRDWLDQQLIS